jgi:putative transcriptional regulator
MLKDNLKILRKNKGLSQEELAIKLNVVRQTISKWETGLSVPDAEMLISISEVFDTPVSTILGENIKLKEKDDIKVISEKLEIINEQLAIERKHKRSLLINTLIIINICIILLYIILVLLGSPYQSWDTIDSEWIVIKTIWHSFEWIYFKIAPIIVLITTFIIILLKRNR